MEIDSPQPNGSNNQISENSENSNNSNTKNEFSYASIVSSSNNNNGSNKRKNNRRNRNRNKNGNFSNSNSNSINNSNNNNSSNNSINSERFDDRSLFDDINSNNSNNNSNTLTIDNSGLGSNETNEHKTSGDYYFDSYSHFGIHEEMLKDRVRTETYMDAILQNGHLFKDKIVLDIGAGTGILCLFAAKAGAKHVIGVECASIANSARKIIEENGYSDKITIVRGKVEEIELPNNITKVDIIISEWMGYFLLYESMLNTVLYARDKWLKPNGIIMPDKSNLYVCGIEDGDYMRSKISFWDNVYGFKMTCLKEAAMREPLVDVVPSNAIITDSYRILRLDLYKCTIADLTFQSKFTIRSKYDNYCHAIVSYFDIIFSKSHTKIGFSTSPLCDYTHWKQTVFYLDSPLTLNVGQEIKGHITVTPNKKNARDLDILLETKHFSKYGNTHQKRLYLMR